MKRRRILTVCGTVAAGMLAGCSGGGDGGSPTGTATGTSEPTGTATATPEPTGTETATATPEPTATATPDSSAPTHGLDESFTVGSGDAAVGYRIVDLYRTDRVGNSANNATADGTYLLVVLELSNPRDEAISFPRNEFIVGNEEQIRYVDDDATPKVADDERIDIEPIGTATVLAGASKTGAVLFDVDPDRSYRIRVHPTGDSGETHYVDVGPIADIQSLESSIV